jgi:hypothetical protein
LGYDVEKIYLTSMALEQALIETIRELSPQQQQAVLNFARSLTFFRKKSPSLLVG